MELIGFAIAQFILLVVGLLAGAVCWALAELTQRRKSERRAGIFRFAFILPTVTLFYIEGSYIAYGLVEDALGRDTYVEGIYHYPLVNGYRLVIMDKMPEQAYIESEKRPIAEAVSEVREFQVSGGTILVTSHKDVSGSDWGPDKPADQFRIIDTMTGSVRSFDSMVELNSVASSSGVVLHLRTVQDVLSRAVAKARPGWWFIPLLLVPPLLLAWRHRARERDLARSLSVIRN